MITTVSSVTALNAALKAAQAGDSILLTAGTYTGTVASYLNFAGNVTVTSADAGHPATLTNLNVTSSSGLTFSGLDFRADGAGPDNPFLVARSHDVTLTGLDVHGSADGLQNDRAAMLVRDSANVTVSDSVFHDLWIGIGHLNNDHLTIAGNTFKEIQMDGIRGGGSSFVTITRNTFSNFHPAATDHPDAIQFWTSNTTTSAHDIAVTENVFMRGSGTGVIPQGIFFNDEVGTLPYQHLTITGNMLAGAGYNGIAIFHGDDVVVKDNVVVGFMDYKSWIRLEKVDGGTVSGNETTLLMLTATDTNLVSTDNIIVAQVSDGGAAYLSAWQAIYDAPTNATFTGTSGADTLVGSAGADVLSGGLGDDVYVVNSTGDSVVEAIGGGSDLVQSALSQTLAGNVERLTLTGAAAVNGYGNELANVLTGNGAANLLSGGAGNDTLNGGAGGDTLQGGDGADKIVGGLGADRMEGGAGDDYYIVDDPNDLCVETLTGTAGGYDYVAASVGYTLGANVERLTLSGAGAMDGAGNALGNLISGGAGANKLSGLAGADTLSGLGGDDTLVGGTGDDVLTGGAGADRFVFAVGDGHDQVRDFGAGGEHDAVDVSAFLMAGYLPTLTDAAGGVTISFATGDSIYLTGIHPASLQATSTGWVF
jgi:Ca2+-binding RTX toxin-like protein